MSKPDFEKIFASGGTTLPLTDSQFLQGFAYLGENPPTKEEFNWLFQQLCLKMQWLNQNAGFGRWQADHNYTAGEICFSSVIGDYRVAECTIGGQSGTVEPTWGAVGASVTDGGVTWVVRDLRQGTSIGKIPALVDVGGGKAGLPAVSGKLLTDMEAASARKNSTSYTLGAIVTSPNLPSYAYAECTTAGTSATTEPAWSAVGSATTDGTATWTIRDNRVASDAADNSTKKVTTSWLRTNIQSLVSGCIAAVATAAGFSYTLGTTGYIKFPSWLAGILIQWGTIIVGTNTGTWPISFSSGVYSVVCSALSGQTGTGSSRMVSVTLSGFTSYANNPDYGNYIVIGK